MCVEDSDLKNVSDGDEEGFTESKDPREEVDKDENFEHVKGYQISSIHSRFNLYDEHRGNSIGGSRVNQRYVDFEIGRGQ